MKEIINKILLNKSSFNIGFLFFCIGIFFLPSTLFISILFLLPAALIGSFLQNKSYLEDKWNYPFLIFGILITLSSLFQNYVLTNNYELIWDPINSFIGLGNWLPFIWLFWSLQPYLKTESKRRYVGLIIITGTFPVLLTGFGQYFFDWTGPFKTLNGLIIWYQRPIENPSGLSGLFNNQNYAGSWLNIAWPFCIALFLERGKKLFRRTIAFGFLLSTGFAAFLTFSRNAWIGLLTSIPIVIGRKGIKFLLGFMIILFLSFFIISLIFKQNTLNVYRLIVPEKILLEFLDEGYQKLDSTRIEIYLSAIKLIKNNPIFGIGATSFSQIYFLNTNFWKGHSHNLLLELALSYGLPATLIFLVIITLILYLSGKKIFFKTNGNSTLFDRAFWSAIFFFMASQLVDIQYFDGKLSFIMWILLAGLKNIIDENRKEIEVS